MTHFDAPRPLSIALKVLVWTACLGLVAAFAERYLGWAPPNYVLIGAFVAATIVGMELARLRRAPLSGWGKWAVACWFTSITLALAAAVLALDDRLDHQLLVLQEPNLVFLLIIAVLTAALFVPLTVVGLWLGERVAIR